MKLLNGEIFMAHGALDTLSEKDLPVKASFGLAKLKIAIGKLYDAIEGVRNTLVNKHGEKDDKGSVR